MRVVSDLHNYREFSQPLECLYQAVQTQKEKFSIAFIKELSREEKQLCFFMTLIKNAF